MADYIIELRIPEAKIADFKQKMLAWTPKSKSFTGTDAEWIELQIKRIIRNKYRRGAIGLGEIDRSVIQ